jgi:hypothetical protein
MLDTILSEASIIKDQSNPICCHSDQWFLGGRFLNALFLLSKLVKYLHNQNKFAERKNSQKNRRYSEELIMHVQSKFELRT